LGITIRFRNEALVMSNIQDQFTAFGVAQVMVILKAAPTPTAARPTAALAAAVPVAASRRAAGGAEAVVADLAKYFKVSEMSADTALAMSAKAHKQHSRGTNWYRRAAAPSDPTPPVRFFPNLGVLLGTVDQAGLSSLQTHARVDQVVAPPVPSLIRPVNIAAAKPRRETTWGIRRINADRLHQQGITGQGIVVGHLDTGADGTHPALKSAFHAFAEFDDLGFEVTPTPQPHDTDEHGTHTAGTIAGRTVAGRAIGVAPDALLASAIVIEGGNVNARILAGMDWVIGQGAKVLSMSLGIRGFTDAFLAVTQILRTKGILPVFAVGNEGAGTSRSPGNYEEALSVGAMDENDKVADFSSSRRFNRPNNPLVPDVVAPGVNVISAKPSGGYQSMDGSSMATPHMAGLAALLMQAAPTATIDQVEQCIFSSCSSLPGESVDRQNRGVPDAVKALACLTGGAAPVAAVRPKRHARKAPKKKREKGKARARR
jgi:subtilisin family serine protease